MNHFNWYQFSQKLKEHGYSAELLRDDNGKLIGYRIQRGNSRYNASEIGRQLTASRIEATWKQLHKDMDAEAAKIKAEEQKDKEEYGRMHHFVCEPICPNTKKVHLEYDHSFGKDKEAEHYTFDISQNIVDAFSSAFKALENEFVFVFEEVIETAFFVFFEMISVPGWYGYSSGGGGGNNDLPHKKKDDDEELLRARMIAKAIAHSYPRKVVSQSFHR